MLTPNGDVESKELRMPSKRLSSASDLIQLGVVESQKPGDRTVQSFIKAEAMEEHLPQPYFHLHIHQISAF